MLVLEEAEAAERARRRVLGELLGYGATADAHHLTAPEPTGRGAARAIELALPTPASSPGDVDYVNAHGTSTPLNDRSETEALKLALGEDAAQSIPVSRRSRRSATCSAPPARWRRSRRCWRCGSGSPRRRSATRSPTRASTSTTCPARRAPLDERRTDAGARRSRTRSGSAATTPCSAWRHDGHADTRDVAASAPQRGRAGRGPAADRARAARAALRPGLAAHDPLDRAARAAWATARARATASSPAPGAIDGRPVFCYAQDAGFIGGSLGEAHADTIVRVLELGGRAARVPVVGFVESGGARMQEGTAALARLRPDLPRRRRSCPAACPQISVVAGVSAGGGAYSPALTDFVVMTDERAHVPDRPAGGRARRSARRSTLPELGGPRVHERNGVCQLVRRRRRRRRSRSSASCSRYLPRHASERAAAARPCAAGAAATRPGVPVPRSRAASTTCATSSAAIVDGGELLELAARWARNMVTALARHRRPPGRRRRQPAAAPRRRASTPRPPRRRRSSSHLRPLRAAARRARRHARVHARHAGRRRRGVIRHGASLLRAFAAARVPKRDRGRCARPTAARTSR